MRIQTRLVAGAFASLALIAPLTSCNDDPGEDEIGDNEVIDEGD